MKALSALPLLLSLGVAGAHARDTGTNLSNRIVGAHLRAHLAHGVSPPKAVRGALRGALLVLDGEAGEFDGDWGAPRRSDGLGPDGREHPLDRGLRNVVDASAGALPTHDPHFLVVLTAFGVDRPAPLYVPLANDVTGIGWQRQMPRETFSVPGRALEGVVVMGPVSAFEAGRAALGRALFRQELAHRWGAFVYARGPDGAITTLHLGRGCAHWSALTDVGGASLGGNSWEPNGTEAWRPRPDPPEGFGDLDRYLMGLLPPEAVPPARVILGPGWPCAEPDRAGTPNPAWADSTLLGGPGDAVSGVPWRLAAEDIIAVEGARVPDHAHARRRHEAIFVLVTRPGDPVDDGLIARADALRQSWEADFERATATPGWPGLDLVTDPGDDRGAPDDTEPRDGGVPSDANAETTDRGTPGDRADPDAPRAPPDAGEADAAPRRSAPRSDAEGGCGARPGRAPPASGWALAGLVLLSRRWRRARRSGRGSAGAC